MDPVKTLNPIPILQQAGDAAAGYAKEHPYHTMFIAASTLVGGGVGGFLMSRALGTFGEIALFSLYAGTNSAAVATVTPPLVNAFTGTLADLNESLVGKKAER